MPNPDDPLYEFFPDWILDTVRTEIRVPDRACDQCCNRTAVMVGWPSRQPAASGLLKIGSNPDIHTIVLHPDYYKPETATGQSLRAHEFFHVWQRSVVPDFEKQFHDEAVRTEALGLKPWQNGFEDPAYEFERQVRAKLLAQGWPL